MARRGQRLQMRPNPLLLPPHLALPPVRAGLRLSGHTRTHGGNVCPLSAQVCGARRERRQGVLPDVSYDRGGAAQPPDDAATARQQIPVESWAPVRLQRMVYEVYLRHGEVVRPRVVRAEIQGIMVTSPPRWWSAEASVAPRQPDPRQPGWLPREADGAVWCVSHVDGLGGGVGGCACE